MAKLYSIDLRERTVAAVLKGGLSRHRPNRESALDIPASLQSRQEA
jgi:hypothetical protein